MSNESGDSAIRSASGMLVSILFSLFTASWMAFFLIVWRLFWNQVVTDRASLEKARHTESAHSLRSPPMTKPHRQWTTREASKWAMWQYSHPYLVTQSFSFLDGRVAIPGKCGFKRGELGVCDLYTSSATLLSKQGCLWIRGRDLGVCACSGGARLAGKRGGGRRTVCGELDG